LGAPRKRRLGHSPFTVFTHFEPFSSYSWGDELYVGGHSTATPEHDVTTRSPKPRSPGGALRTIIVNLVPNYEFFAILFSTSVLVQAWVRRLMNLSTFDDDRNEVIGVTEVKVEDFL
jgi:hypothetical protein